MVNIRVNITNREGKRTSTTINGNIVDYYCHAIFKSTFTDDEKRKILNEFIKNNEYMNSKDNIEEELLSKIYYADPWETSIT